ncbi:MAG TPA: glycosyltransferase family 39 protein [Silvibacterium sp.]|nr:glycosyltransferase family 39 protein [Silvibacterium sp.]
MEVSEGVSARGAKLQARSDTGVSIPDWARYGTYAAALAVAISTWFIAIRSPLFLDETDAFWQISSGFSGLWASQFQPTTFPAYPFILLLATKVLGTREIALRVPSLLATVGAVYLLYLAAREFFSRETATLAVVIFSVHPIIVFASINVRPYSFGALAICATFLVLFRLRRSDSIGIAALFGLLAAVIVYFNFLFVAILPAMVLCFFLVKPGEKHRWRQFGFALGAFALAFLPLIPGLLYLLRVRNAHVYEKAAKVSELLWTVAPSWLPFVFAGAALVALVVAALTTRPGEARPTKVNGSNWRAVTACVSLAFVPLLILYAVSAWTSLHVFTAIHRTIAVPGIALCWAWIAGRFRPEIRLLFCVALVAATSIAVYRSPDTRQPEYTWKYAIQAAEKNASPDNAPVLVCSNFPEADYLPMPLDSAKTSHLFAPLSYYKLSVPVVPMPRTLNNEAIKVGSQFLRQAARKHERFLAMGDTPSYKILDWLTRSASPNFDVSNLGVFDQTEVLEFDPRAPAAAE